jgi:hypothetical protein
MTGLSRTQLGVVFCRLQQRRIRQGAGLWPDILSQCDAFTGGFASGGVAAVANVRST